MNDSASALSVNDRPDNATALLGSWRLTAMVTSHAGEVTHPLGIAPSGDLRYDPDGRMSVHLCRGGGPVGESRMPDYTAYFGRYSLDLASRTVVHHIEVGSIPGLAGTDQQRHFRLDGTRLLLSAKGAHGETTLEWHRDEAAQVLADAPPAGFVPLPSPGAFPNRSGRFYTRALDTPAPVVGTRIGIAQSNSEGFAHGGFLLTFADFAVTMTISGITLNLSADFLRPARIGDWIEARIVTRKRAAGLIFADAIATCEGRDILRVSGLFKPFERPE
jgi:hypothetical protein